MLSPLGQISGNLNSLVRQMMNGRDEHAASSRSNSPLYSALNALAQSRNPQSVTPPVGGDQVSLSYDSMRMEAQSSQRYYEMESYSSNSYQSMRVFEESMHFELEARIGNRQVTFEVEYYRQTVEMTSVQTNATSSQAPASAPSLSDFSPEAVSDRILNFAKKGFSRYQNNHSEMNTDEQKNNYAEMIRNAVQEGFDRAKNILGDLYEKNDEVKSNAQTTLEMIMQGLNQFQTTQAALGA